MQTYKVVVCNNCNKQFNKHITEIKRSKKHYCSRKCFHSFKNTNFKHNKTKKCLYCDNLILSTRQKCPNCIKNIDDILSIKDLKQSTSNNNSYHGAIRSRAREKCKKLNWHSCEKCGYDKHVEICHIKAISEFDETAKISEVNAVSNLIALCPNCHWEFDHENRLINDTQSLDS